jgi:hypothetical protein
MKDFKHKASKRLTTLPLVLKQMLFLLLPAAAAAAWRSQKRHK